jgi:flagellin
LVTSNTAGKDAVAGENASFFIDFSGKSVKDLIGTTLNVNGTVYEFTTSATPTQQGNTAVNLGGITAEDEKAGTDTAKIAQAFQNAVGSSSDWDIGIGDGKDAEGNTVINSKITYEAKEAGKQNIDVRHGNADGITFQIGSDATADQRVHLTVKDMSTKGLGLESISIASKQDATDAITKIKNAINTVSGTRSDFGALQNRLEHTVNNLSTTSENLTSAESRIRDVDMSSEMVEMTKNQILSQAATAMLAQANTQPQGVLQLLK